ncbi:uncharacterized protein LOC125239114 [Leguminivora glycinivorella]|uniref:uncharacterized protein LOC125237677 n=1 Tax=Leguminivora glycinivorella TaxID=1035111 RepID=UPI00200CAE94|nr:uncharacterized protein LOC125237677 [Leguminivora glycinivorella]XP_048002509.1 uncharacterized protein LOC125239075 [Leguminivora glycinivorella]XP_048002564.1 uncharacterized protein LOC125239114 [Leguminivora glycinivorella]XP_048002565.1 uncharacterized protein LOC125239114 [Leguminivora glycinivorella]
MYSVVEFAEDSGGGVSIVRREWLTPGKQRCLWPPQKLMTKFNKCIDGTITADTNSWEIFEIKRVFYETDSLAKARDKEKQAEEESEVNSDSNDVFIRKRKKTKKIYDSDSCSNSDDNNIVYPTPPATKLVFPAKTSERASCTGEKSNKHTVYSDDDYEAYTDEKNRTYRKQVTSSVQSTPVGSKSQKQRSRPVYTELNKSDDDTDLSIRENSKESSAKTTDSEVSQLLQSPSGLDNLDLTITPFINEKPNSQALDVIAKHLARIEADLKEMQIAQNEILIRMRSSSVSMEHSLPGEITLPCEDSKDLIDIEKWINAAPENRKLLINHLSLVGGPKIPVIIRRILEKLFSNNLAVLCNWTGKNKKIALKDLGLIKIIRDAVRLNQVAANATDAEIQEIISNWFRFTKDRNGGREARRAKQ